MPLNYQDQINLLQDILSNHGEDCCGSVAECEQVERLVKSLMVNQNMTSEAKPVLQEIYNYSQHGKYTSDLDEHILANQENLSNWVDDIGQFS